MINSREYLFIHTLFSKEENKHLFSKITDHYQNEIPFYFENLIIYVFTYSETIDFTIDEKSLNLSIEILENNKDKLIELLHYNHELKIHSNILNFIYDRDSSNFQEILTVEDIKNALKIFQRQNFKESFKHLDKVNFLSDKDIISGLKVIKRNEFKVRFREIDKLTRSKTPIVKLNFVTISKYAAIVILAVSLTYFFNTNIFNSNKLILVEETRTNKSKNNFIPYSPIDINIASSFNSNQKVLRIPSLGVKNLNSSFNKTVKQIEGNEIVLSFSVLDNREARTLIEKLSLQIKEYPNRKNEIQTKINKLEQQISSHKNTYVFNNQKCTLYINEVFNLKSFNECSIVCLSNGFIDHFYLKHLNTYFELVEDIRPNSLIETNDENILKNLTTFK